MNNKETKFFIDTELKKAAYKIENNDLIGAENIYENIAITYNEPMVWVAIGNLKFQQLETGETTVQQALNCFSRAVLAAPNERNFFENTYCELSILLIDKFHTFYTNVQKKIKEEKTGKFWNIVLTGAAIGFGVSRSNNTNNVFKGVAGTAGAVYGLHKVGEHSRGLKDVETAKAFLENTIKDLIRGVKNFCADNPSVYKKFTDHLDQLSSTNKSFQDIQQKALLS